MTLLELIRGTLEQLDRGTDAQTIEAWRDKLTRYFNDALEDLTAAVPPRYAQTVPLTDGGFSTDAFDRTCLKVLAVYIRGQRWPFYYGPTHREVRIPGQRGGEALVVYRTAMRPLAIDTDVPDLPESYHSALILYALGRERSMGDGTSMAAARGCFELYAARRRSLIQNYGNGDTRFYNCF